MAFALSCQPRLVSPLSLHYSKRHPRLARLPKSEILNTSFKSTSPPRARVERQFAVFASQNFEKPVRLLRTFPSALETHPSEPLGQASPFKDDAGNSAADVASGVGANGAQEEQKPADATSLYVIHVKTSSEPLSGMSMPGGGVLLALIGEGGDTISVRLEPQEEGIKDQESKEQLFKTVEEERTNAAATGIIPVVATAFAAGQTAEIRLMAPSIGAVTAAWLAPQRGATWRVDSMAITVVPNSAEEITAASAEAGAAAEVAAAATTVATPAVQYTLLPGPFSSNFLGDPSGGGNSGNTDTPTAIQLRVAKTQTLDPSLALAAPGAVGTAAEAAEQARKKREDGLREYEELKRLMLLVTTGLVVTGTGAAGWLGGADTAVAFAAGGAAAFVYLLRLQTRVDELPSTFEASGELKSVPEAPSSGMAKEGESGGADTLQLVRSIGVRAALATLAIGSAVALLGGVSGGGGGGDGTIDGGLLAGGLQVVKIQPQQFAAGVLGFLSHKLAVLLVAFTVGSKNLDE
ncbi:hypothetical protein CLOM_g19154 [Closterium sp. NIES-68]|nr:hypothetical protein CLOM_g19154 [Closterium sp. NIES-68]GJP65574.1 hypothetical protein CLOP_g22449 [Closterium sp. NIES-67]